MANTTTMFIHFLFKIDLLFVHEDTCMPTRKMTNVFVKILYTRYMSLSSNLNDDRLTVNLMNTNPENI